MPKVSIITPVYNGERFIERYFDMVLKFTHKDLELIIVNDASTDNTNEIIEQTKEKLINNGIEFKYIRLEKNEGAAGAINHGLQEVTGEYLSWQDIDDIYYPECISKCVEYSQIHPECKIIFTKCAIVKEDNLDEILSIRPRKKIKYKNLFLDYILEKNDFFSPLRFVETKALFSVLKDRSIYVSQAGQNWQMFLPMLYAYRWGYIDEILSKYVIYTQSHSHSISYNTNYNKHKDILINTIERMNIPTFKKRFYQLRIRRKYLRKSMNKLLRISINLKYKTVMINILNHNFQWRIK